MKLLTPMGAECVKQGLSEKEILDDPRFEGILWQPVEMGMDDNGKPFMRIGNDE